MNNNNYSPHELRSEEWIRKAHDDALSARSIVRHRDGAPSGVCFLAHQMTEKYLKAFFVAHKQWFPKIHALGAMVEHCSAIDSSCKTLKDDAIFLNEFYVPTRYPGDYPEFSWKDADDAFRAACRIEKFVLKKLQKIKK